MRKYRNRPVEADGFRFDSLAEHRRYQTLKLLERATTISALIVHPRFELLVNGMKVCTYVGDFQYQFNGDRVVEDVKGVETAVFRLKKKLMQACHGISVGVVR